MTMTVSFQTDVALRRALETEATRSGSTKSELVVRAVP